MVGSDILSRIKILVVDDDSSVGELMIKLLSREGCQAAYYSHPVDALEAYQKNSFDLAFVDMNMPDINGLELAMKLKKLNWHDSCFLIFYMMSRQKETNGK